jgi:hypothetical protein
VGDESFSDVVEIGDRLWEDLSLEDPNGLRTAALSIVLDRRKASS